MRTKWTLGALAWIGLAGSVGVAPVATPQGGITPISRGQYCVSPYLGPSPEGEYECDRSECDTAPCPWGGYTITNVIGYECKPIDETSKCRVTGATVTLEDPSQFTCEQVLHPQCPAGQFQCQWEDTGQTGPDQDAIDCETY